MPFDHAQLRESDVSALADAFHRMHERIYTIKNEADEVEFTTWTVRAIGLRDAASLGGSQDGTLRLQPLPTRQVFIGAERAFQALPVHNAGVLGEGDSIDGPALLDSHTTTVLIHAGQRATIDIQGNCCVERC